MPAIFPINCRHARYTSNIVLPRTNSVDRALHRSPARDRRLRNGRLKNRLLYLNAKSLSGCRLLSDVAPRPYSITLVREVLLLKVMTAKQPVIKVTNVQTKINGVLIIVRPSLNSQKFRHGCRFFEDVVLRCRAVRGTQNDPPVLRRS